MSIRTAVPALPWGQRMRVYCPKCERYLGATLWGIPGGAESAYSFNGRCPDCDKETRDDEGA